MSFRIRPRARGSWALSIGVVATLALGVAALTTTFAIVRAALWREPPFPDADRLGILFLERTPANEPPRRERWSFARAEQLRTSQQSFDAIATFSPASLTLSGGRDDGNAELVYGERVSAQYLPMLGARATSGRVFVEADDDPGRPSPIAVVNERLWQRRFAGEAFAADRTIRLNGVTITIVGIVPAGFRGLSGRADVWIPRTVSPQITYAEYLTTNQNFIPVVGRLRPGVDWRGTQAELGVLAAAINRALPSDPRQPDERVSATAVPLNQVRGDPTARRSLPVLLAAVAMLHLLACANVANLLLGRAAVRRHEFALRLALGSGSGRLFRHVLAEGVALALVGGGLGVMAAWRTTGFLALPRNASGALGIVAPFDGPAFSAIDAGFGAGLAIVTALLVALMPALTAYRADAAAGVRSSTRTASGRAMSVRRPTLRAMLVAVEVAVAAVLVVGAGLLWDSFQRMQRADVGVDADHVLTFWVIPSEARVPPATGPAFVGRVIDAIARVPGVEGVTVDGGAPLSGAASSTLYIAGQPAPDPGQAPPVLRHYIAPDHFRTLGIPLLQGRPFTTADTTDAPRVAVISETAARRFWPRGDAIGQRVWFGGGSNFNSPERSAVIVGIVGDVAYQPFDRGANFASFYTPYTQFTYPARAVFVRTTQDPLAALPEVRRAVASVDPELALQDTQLLADQLRASWARQRLDTALFSGFGLAALGLAASGIFAVLAYSVSTRRREFGIRIALGARSGRIVRLVLGEGMTFPIAGLVIGLAASLALTRLLQASLYETSPLEPRVFLSMGAVLLAAALVASLIPAWRATKADPVESLRAE